MSEKLSEWLDQYTEVSNKQQQYLTRIQELRHGLQQRENKRLISTIDKMRGDNRSKYRRKYPLYSLSRMEEASVKQGPAPFPNRPCRFHDDKHGISKLKIAPHVMPRKLAPIVTKVKTSEYGKTSDEDSNAHKATPRPEMEAMKTEYESFESIAKRNKLNLTHFFNSSLSHRRARRRRLPMSVSTVTILEEAADDAEPNDFITDISSRKPVVNLVLRDNMPG